MSKTPKMPRQVLAFEKNIMQWYGFKKRLLPCVDICNDNEKRIKIALSLYFDQPFLKIISSRNFCFPIDFSNESGIIVSEGKAYLNGPLVECDRMSGGVAVTEHKRRMLELATGILPHRCKVIDPCFAKHGILAYLDGSFEVWIITIDKIIATIHKSMSRLEQVRNANKVVFQEVWGQNRDMKCGPDPSQESVHFIQTKHWCRIAKEVNGEMRLIYPKKKLAFFEIPYSYCENARNNVIRLSGG